MRNKRTNSAPRQHHWRTSSYKGEWFRECEKCGMLSDMPGANESCGMFSADTVGDTVGVPFVPESYGDITKEDKKFYKRVAAKSGIPYDRFIGRIRRGMTVDEAVALGPEIQHTVAMDGHRAFMRTVYRSWR